MIGFVKESRAVENYGWKDHPAVVIRSFLLHRANIADAVISGLQIRRGQLLTSYESIMAATGFSKQQVRSALRRLVEQHVINTSDAFKATRQATGRPTCRGLLITLIDYDCLEGPEDKANTSPNTSPNNEPTCGAHVAQYQYKKKTKKEIKKEPVSLNPPSRADLDEFCREKGLSTDIDGFMAYYTMRNWQIREGTPLYDWRAALGYWANKQGKKVSAQEYMQRQYQPGELDALGADLMAEARAAREEGTV